MVHTEAIKPTSKYNSMSILFYMKLIQNMLYIKFIVFYYIIV